MSSKNQKVDHKLLIVTRGDYITRLTLDKLLRTYPSGLLKVIIVKSDSHGRKGIAQLKALWRDYEWHYFLFELYQFLLFKFAQIIFPNTPFSVESLTKSLNIAVTNTDNINSAEIITFAQTWQPDVLLSVKCTQRIHSALLSVAKLGSINVHSSLLPKYAGRAPHFWAMAHAEKMGGTTVHYMNEAFDEGNILLHKSMPLSPAMSVFSVISAVAKLGSDALLQALPMVFSGTTGTPQNSRERSYYSSPTKSAYTQLRNNGYKLLYCGEIVKAICAEIRTHQQRAFNP